MHAWPRFAAALAVASLAFGCANPPRAPLPPIPGDGRIELTSLPGWAVEDHATALGAFVAGCAAVRGYSRLTATCEAARSVRPAGARPFLERTFVAEAAAGEGLLTGYYAPEYPARDSWDADFSAPVRPRPADLQTNAGGEIGRVRDGVWEAYPVRALIDRRVTTDALAWMRPEDLFFLQIQGSGTLTFADGRRQRAAFAAHNGRPFVGIAKPMRERGLLADDQTSGANISAWLAAHRGPEADALMAENPRYVFFRMEPDDGREPAGAAGVRLPPARAVAVDPAHHAYGAPLWIDADAGALAGAFPRYSRMVSALDTGGAIRGEVRADLYLGRGAAAGVEAGRIRHRLRLWRLVPR